MSRTLTIYAVLLFAFSYTNSAIGAEKSCSVGSVSSYHLPFFINKVMTKTSAKISFCFVEKEKFEFKKLVSDFAKASDLDGDADYLKRLFDQADSYNLVGAIVDGNKRLMVIKFLFGEKTFTYTMRLSVKEGKNYSFDMNQNASPLEALLGYVFELNEPYSDSGEFQAQVILNHFGTDEPQNQISLDIPEKLDLNDSSTRQLIVERNKNLEGRQPDSVVSNAMPDIAVILEPVILLFYKSAAGKTYGLESYLESDGELKLVNERYSDDIISTFRSRKFFEQLMNVQVDR